MGQGRHSCRRPKLPSALPLPPSPFPQFRLALADPPLDSPPATPARPVLGFLPAGWAGRSGRGSSPAPAISASAAKPRKPHQRPREGSTPRSATAKTVKPGRKRAISPSRVRVPSGNISTISPRFSRRNDSLIPPRPIPSRSIEWRPPNGSASRTEQSQRACPGPGSSSAADSPCPPAAGRNGSDD